MAAANPHLIAIDGPIPLTRATPEELQAEVQAAANSPILCALLNALDAGMVVLNRHRQIVAANLRHLVAEPEQAAEEALGLRPGEALGCIHAAERPAGCGASETCRTCGWLRTMLDCQSADAPAEGECLLTTGSNGSFELRLRATPVKLDGHSFTVVAIRDVADEKRRDILEQVFFHDLLNLVTALSNWSQMLLKMPEERIRKVAERVAALVERIEAEICGQRALRQAENGTLQLHPSTVRTGDVLRELVSYFATHPRGRALVLGDSADFEIQTDSSLLFRVLTNMVTNALEATSEGGGARVWCEKVDQGTPWACVYHVHNEAVMPRDVAMHVFERSFSTKARHGRGLGTYSMKLLGERYLGGAVSFVSRAGEGTVFSLRLPAGPVRGAQPKSSGEAR